MKLTKKSVKHEVETTEMVCEITPDEFNQICAETAASTIIEVIGPDATASDLAMGVAMTALLAQYARNLEDVLFADTNENPDKKEEK
jgi:hypothetical protein